MVHFRSFNIRTLITTVGISLLTNYRRETGIDFRPLLPDTTVLAEWASRTGWANASAEANTWHLLGVKKEEPTRAILLHSDSPEGTLCAGVLIQLASERAMQGELVLVAGLSTHPGQGRISFNRALARLARAIIDAIHNGFARGTTEIVATGGFKPETSIAHQVGSVLQVPVHYIHEAFREVVTLDPLPVALDLAWISAGPGRSLLGFFQGDKDRLVSQRELSPLLKQDERLWLLLDHDPLGTEAGLNVLGQMAMGLLGGPAMEWPMVCPSPAADKIQMNMSHHKPSGWDAWLDRISRSAYVTNIRFEQVRLGSSRMIGPAPDSESDLLGSYSDGVLWRGARIGTTATNSTQRLMVINLLNQELKRFN